MCYKFHKNYKSSLEDDEKIKSLPHESVLCSDFDLRPPKHIQDTKAITCLYNDLVRSYIIRSGGKGLKP